MIFLILHHVDVHVCFLFSIIENQHSGGIKIGRLFWILNDKF